MGKLIPHILDTSVRLSEGRAGADRVTPESPALEVMTDLRSHRAVTVQPEDTLGLADRVMAAAHVRLLFVADAGGSLEGVVTYRDLHGERALTAAARERTAHEALPVSRLMTPSDQVEAVSLDAVTRARVRDVVSLLRDHGRQHTLVTEADGHGGTRVCGLFSLTQIGRQLGLDIQATERVQSFAEIEHLIAHG